MFSEGRALLENAGCEGNQAQSLVSWAGGTSSCWDLDGECNVPPGDRSTLSGACFSTSKGGQSLARGDRVVIHGRQATVLLEPRRKPWN